MAGNWSGEDYAKVPGTVPRTRTLSFHLHSIRLLPAFSISELLLLES